MFGLVARKLDDRLRKVLIDVFSDSASNVPEFTRTAREGVHRKDEGYQNLLPAEWTERESIFSIKGAIVVFLQKGGTPSIEDSEGDAAMQFNPGLFFHFRVAVGGARLFIKVLLDEDDPDEPTALVISVKRDDQAWK